MSVRSFLFFRRIPFANLIRACPRTGSDSSKRSDLICSNEKDSEPLPLIRFSPTFGDSLIKLKLCDHSFSDSYEQSLVVTNPK